MVYFNDYIEDFTEFDAKANEKMRLGKKPAKCKSGSGIEGSELQ